MGSASTYSFDSIIDRRNTYAIKYDFEGKGKPEGTIPLWVADMDFAAPPCVTEALAQNARHGVFGYSDTDAAYFETLRRWFAKRFGWTPEPSWHFKTPGVVLALYTAVRAFTEKGDAILIQEPVYYPFASSARDNERKLVVSRLVRERDGNGEETGRYEIDFDDFEKKIIQEGVKLFILCNPHNPVGRAWAKDELARLGDICLRRGVKVFSDEIHQDFVYPGCRHTVFAGISDALADITATATAPSKTFNLAGLEASNIFIKDRGLRAAFAQAYARTGLSQNPVTGLVACKAAYDGGEGWLDALLVYLQGNIELIARAVSSWQERNAGIGFCPPEATYLGWIDFRALGLGDKDLDDWLTKQAKVWLSPGRTFGAGGSGFMRINFACPKSVLSDALGRITDALQNFPG
ncbi:MAG: pyridoxal phosphate-dependent aminotransferase [Clostridiales Family XIII bacterium]|nr:pyridoxal phosphate-dependent aminotransferase [Clostridiales Family XIII bacterium]